MFKSYFETLSNCFRIPELRSRIVFTLMLLAVCRMIALTPVPGIKGWELSEHFEEQRAARAAKQQTTGAKQQRQLYLLLGVGLFIQVFGNNTI